MRHLQRMFAISITVICRSDERRSLQSGLLAKAKLRIGALYSETDKSSYCDGNNGK